NAVGSRARLVGPRAPDGTSAQGAFAKSGGLSGGFLTRKKPGQDCAPGDRTGSSAARRYLSAAGRLASGPEGVRQIKGRSERPGPRRPWGSVVPVRTGPQSFQTGPVVGARLGPARGRRKSLSQGPRPLG